MNTAIATNTASLSLVVDNTVAKMSLFEISEMIGVRFDNLKVSMQRLIDRGVIQSPAMQVIKNHQNRNIKDYVFIGEQGRLDSIVLIAQNVPEMTKKLVERWDQLEKENAELKTELANKEINPFANMSKLDWMRKAVELEEEKEQLVSLHIRKSVDAHSMTRLLGEKKGSVRVQEALNALKEAGYITRRFNDAGKPCGYDLNESGYMFCRMSAHGQLEFTVDVLPVLVKLGVLAEEQKDTLKLPQPNNVKALVDRSVKDVKANTLSLVSFGI
ncbi:hypothetical protein A4M37_19360 [Salmonella enterica subsp. enterica serovar Typhimurium]|nr:hypothetical protein [Salmonella enterica subsp. enterica serovar Typhimurium]